MKKIIITILIILGVVILVFFMVKISSQNILVDLIGEDKETFKTENVKTLDNSLLNKKAPYFDLLSVNGKRIKSSEFIDKPFVIVFWSSWSVESANQLKIVDEYVLSNKNNLVPIISINSQEDASIVRSFIRRGDYEVPTALDINGSTTEDYHIRNLPTLFFVNKDGVIVEVYSGVLNNSMLMKKIEQLLD